MKKGLVLEGGAIAWIVFCWCNGCSDGNNIWPDGVIGVSAGAAFGCNMKSKQAGRAIRYNKKLANDWRYASLRSLLTTGDYYGVNTLTIICLAILITSMLILFVRIQWSFGLYVQTLERVKRSISD